MVSRREQKESTRTHLLSTAMVEFAEHGIAVVRTVDVARAAGVSHGTLFVHFPTREALVGEAISLFGREVTRRLHQLAAGSSGLREVLTAHLAGISEYEAFYSRLVAEAPSLPPEARETLVMVQSAVSFHMSQVLEREQAAGTIREVPHHFVFNLWVGLIHHHLINRDLFVPRGSLAERLGPTLVDHFLALLT